MAINLNFQAAPISSFAKPNARAEAADELRIGQAVTNVIGKAEQAYKEHIALRDEREFLRTTVGLSELNSESAVQNDARAYYEGTELEGTDFTGQKYETDLQGRTVSKQIAAWEARPFIEKKERLENLESVASGISDYRLRQKFIAEQRQQIERKFQADQKAAAREGVAQTKWEYANELKILMEQGNYEEAQFLINQSTVHSNEEKAAIGSGIAKESEFGPAREILLRQDLTAQDIADADAMIEYLDSDDPDTYDGALSDKERLSLIGQLKNKIKSDRARKSAKATDEQVRYAMQLDAMIQDPDPKKTTPTVNEQTLWDDYQGGLIVRSAYERLTGKVITRDVKLVEKKIKLDVFSSSIASGLTPADNPENRQVNNDLYEQNVKEYVQSLPEGQPPNPMEIINLGVTQARASQMIPQEVEDEFVAANDSSGAQLHVAGLAYNQYMEKVPVAMSKMNKQSTEVVASYAARLRLGVNPDEAMAAVVAMRNMQPEERKVHNLTWREYTKGGGGQTAKSEMYKSLSNLLEDDPHFNVPGWGGAPDAPKGGSPTVGGIPTDAVLNYQDLVKYHFEREGNMAVAESLAANDFKGIYSITNINSPDDWQEMFGSASNYQVMAYAPPTDKFSTKQIKQQIQDQFGEAANGRPIIVTSNAFTVKSGAVDRNNARFQVVAPLGKDGIEVLGEWIYNPESIRVSVERAAIQENIDDLKLALRGAKDVQYTLPGRVHDERVKTIEEEIALKEALRDGIK